MNPAHQVYSSLPDWSSRSEGFARIRLDADRDFDVRRCERKVCGLPGVRHISSFQWSGLLPGQRQRLRVQLVAGNIHHADGGDPKLGVWFHDVEVRLGVAIEVDMTEKISWLWINLHLMGKTALPGRITRPQIELPETAGDIGVIAIGRGVDHSIRRHRGPPPVGLPTSFVR